MTIRLQASDAIDLLEPPGTTLAEELAARNMSQRELATRMGRSPTVVNDIVHGRKAITAETAIQIEKALGGTTARFWLNLQAQFDLDVARERLARVT